MDECLEGGAVHIDQFVEAVDQRVGGHRGGQRALVGHDLELGDGFGRQVEHFADGLGLFGGEGHLAEQAGGDPFLAEADGLGEVGPLEALGNLAFDDEIGDVFAFHVSLL